jgi:hypothetical protein
MRRTNTPARRPKQTDRERNRSEWSIGIYAGNSPFKLSSQPEIINPVLSREDVSDVTAAFVADPFMLRCDRRWHMFFEVMNTKRDKGEIGLAVSPNGLKWQYHQIVLKEPYHLSYPYVFKWRNGYYMIPETLQSGGVRLYKANPFPVKWSFVRTLIKGQCADPSIFYSQNRWWLFACTTPYRHDALRLYFADDLLGPWFEHPRNPIVEGNHRIARPGGRVLVLKGRVVRFAQDCHPSYGRRVRAFEILRLTPTEYRERELSESPILRPSGRGWNASGMHTIDAHLTSRGRWLACVDGLTCD